MVTEKAGYIGTSNWTEDYFTDTAGSLLNPYLNAQKGLLGDCPVLSTLLRLQCCKVAILKVDFC